MQGAPEADRATVWLLVPEAETLGTASARVLVVTAAAGRPELPRLTLPREMWVAEGVGSLSEQAEARLGVRATVLRHLVDLDGSHICEMEVHAAEWSPPAGSRWVSLAELRDVCGTTWEGTPNATDATEAIERWFGEQSGTVAVPAIRPAWERRGWMDEALGWADRELGRAGLTRAGRPVPVKGAWSGSAILRVPTAAGNFYLKAAYTRPPGEASLVASLSEGWPDAVPEVVAWDAQRNVVLMRDFGGRALWGGPVARWENAARGFGQLQLACGRQLERWLAMGVEDRRLETLPGHFERLLADRPYLWPDHPRGLTAEERAQVEAAIPALMEMVDRLAESGVPASLVQQDFRHGNLAVVPLSGAGSGTEAEGRTHRFVFYDWGDAVVSHPFFSGTRMLDYLSKPYETEPAGPGGAPGWVTYAPPAFHRYLRDAYVEPWTALLPATQLRESFELARTLNPLWQTIRWWLEVPYYEVTSPWGKDSLTWGPHHLRRVLRMLAEK